MKQIVFRILSIVVGFWLLLPASTMAVVHASVSPVNLIVQAASEAELGALADDFSHYGGEITRNLPAINAFAVRMPTHTVYRLGQSPSFAQMWPDYGIKASDSADLGAIYLPPTGVEYGGTSFYLNKCSAYDGGRDILNPDGLNVIDSGHLGRSKKLNPLNVPGTGHEFRRWPERTCQCPGT